MYVLYVCFWKRIKCHRFRAARTISKRISCKRRVPVLAMDVLQITMDTAHIILLSVITYMWSRLFFHTASVSVSHSEAGAYGRRLAGVAYLCDYAGRAGPPRVPPRQVGMVVEDANEKIGLESRKKPRSAESARFLNLSTTRFQTSYIYLFRSDVYVINKINPLLPSSPDRHRSQYLSKSVVAPSSDTRYIR